MVKHNGSDAGMIVVKDFKLVERPTFVEILRSGVQLSLAVAIDYTASNGPIDHPRSLHNLSSFNSY
jgi:hypothetical protein